MLKAKPPNAIWFKLGSTLHSIHILLRILDTVSSYTCKSANDGVHGDADGSYHDRNLLPDAQGSPDRIAIGKGMAFWKPIGPVVHPVTGPDFEWYLHEIR